jgi:hypothetical protein
MDALNGIGHSFFVTAGYEMNLSFGLRSKITSNVQMAALTSKHNALIDALVDKLFSLAHQASDHLQAAGI